MAIHDLCYLALAVLCILLPLLYYVFYRHVLPTFSFIWLQVGGFFLMHCDDMQRVAPLWLSTTEEVREDPEVGGAGV